MVSHVHDRERDETDSEALLYRQLSALDSNPRSGVTEDLRNTPLMSLAVKEAVDLDTIAVPDDGDLRKNERIFDQYGVLGFHTGGHHMISDGEPILMNISAPHSAFLCGSQGSGKSYTLSCMLENCLVSDKRIGRVRQPLAGVAFQYDPHSAGTIAETAFLCSMGIRVNVLVSQSNEGVLRRAYSKLPGAKEYLSVTPLLFHPSDLSIERMHKLMAFGQKEGSVPLYMSVALRVLRQMAIKAKDCTFDYLAFKKALEAENLTKEQIGPLNLRLELLESFLDLAVAERGELTKGLLDVQPGTLTIIDLSDPFMDSATACILFDICLGLVKQRRVSCGLIITLDEAHKYMTSSLAASRFTDSLLGTIREQRHNATRVIIATQEPTVSEKLLDLCSVSIVHRFTSPAWFTAIQNHLGAASRFGRSASEQQMIFGEIMDLQLGESLVFAPSAFLCLGDAGARLKLGEKTIKMKTRTRLGIDGGMSVLASVPDSVTTKQNASVADITEMGSSSTGGLGRSTCTSEFSTYACSTKNNLDRERQTVMSEPNTTVVVDKLALILHQSRSFVVLICCQCKNLLLIQFRQHVLPEFTSLDQKAIRAGLAYVTCMSCQLAEIVETKKASKQFDFARSKEFLDGTIEVDDMLQQNVMIAFRKASRLDTTVLLHNGHLVYLFLRVVQRAIGNAHSVHMIRLVMHQGGDALESIHLSPHNDGDFLKASMQPNGK